MGGIEAEPVATIVVHGTPAPQGSKKFVGMSHAGHAKLVESSKKVAPWRDNVRRTALGEIACTCRLPFVCKDLQPGFPLDEPVLVAMVFTLPKPASAPKRRRTWPDRYPDLSKLARSTEDALKEAGVLADDARIVEYERLAKVFPGEDPDALAVPGVVIRVWRMDDLVNWHTPDPAAQAPSLFDQPIPLS